MLVPRRGIFLPLPPTLPYKNLWGKWGMPVCVISGLWGMLVYVVWGLFQFMGDPIAYIPPWGNAFPHAKLMIYIIFC